MKMVEAFGQQYKSELFKFIEANEDLTESLMVRKWKNSHSWTDSTLEKENWFASF